MAGPNAALDSTPSSADLELRGATRKIQLRASDQVIPHHRGAAQASRLGSHRAQAPTHLKHPTLQHLLSHYRLLQVL